MKFRRLALCILIWAASHSPLRAAELKLAALFSDDAILQRDRPVPVWGWADAGEPITVAFAGQTKTATADAEGKWLVKLDPMPASAEARELVVSSRRGARVARHNVVVGDVWLCSGQSNMDMSMTPFLPWHHGVLNHEREIAAANHPQLRLFHVVPVPYHKPAQDVYGEWLVCTPKTAADFSGVAYYFGQKLLQETGVPQGLLLTSLGGTSIKCWQRHAPFAVDAPEFEQAIPAFVAKSLALARNGGKRPAFPKEPVPGYRNKPGACYHGMLGPLSPCALRGVAWYQGEADTSWAAGYASALKELIAQFRADFHDPALPVYIVQLANHLSPKAKPNAWAELRAQQLAVLREVPHTGLAVAADAGLSDQIHPPDKKRVGERLALWPLAQVYGKQLECSGPIATQAKVAGGRVVISFAHTGSGLTSRAAQPLAGFEVADAQGKFHPAAAAIKGRELEIACPAVPQPAAVRYAWENDPKLTLYNAEGLPASPFQLDLAKP